jgi:excisionase family DNA binding protein
LHRKAYKVNEVAQALGLGRTTIYKLINRGDLRRIKVGATTLIAADSVEALLQRDAA